MSKIDFGPGGLGKKWKKVVVTIMLSFPFFDEKCCDANFFQKNIFKKKQFRRFFLYSK
jgi:hypothetical protein